MATNQSSSADVTTKSIVSHVTAAPIAYHAPLTSIKFNGKNYLDWSRAINIALGGRRLLGYITGETTESDHSSHGDWKATDYSVMSLIIETIAPELSRNFLGAKTAKEMWLAIRSSYSHKEDVTKRLEIKERIRRCMQGNHTVQEYYSQFIGLWDELKECEKAMCPTCTVIANEEREENMIVSFLNGLKSEYEDITSNVFRQITLPSLGAVYSIILREESRWGLVESTISDVEKVETVGRGRVLYHGGWGRGKIPDEKDKLKCSYCGKSRHTREGCWYLIGKPPNFGRGRKAFAFNASSDGIPQIGVTQRGLIPSPENKYLVGKVSDEEDAKQRRLKGILNKLTPQNFDRLFEQVKEVNIDNPTTLAGVISQIFDKALMEPTFCEMYANFCSQLATALPDFNENNEKITFKRLLLNKCQEEFERGEREEAEAAKEEEGELKQTSEEREEKRIKSQRRMLGNIILIGELYKKRMLTERIMHECIKKLLGPTQNPDEEDIEALCKLMSSIGEMIDHVKAKEHMDAYFDLMLKLSNNQKYSSRVRFMLKDTMDLRKNRWRTGTGLPDSVVKEKSISAIREYFSARSEEEVKLCIADMKSPGSYQLIISTWINDSFERKELERDLTYKLLISLCNPKQGLFNQSHLLRGFEGVLSTLEDAIYDAPKAPEYLGQLFAKSITEGLTSLKGIGSIVLQGGEEPGMLIEAGIGGDVIGCVLECVRKVKGDPYLEEVRAKSELNLEDFKPAAPMRSKKLDPFL